MKNWMIWGRFIPMPFNSISTEGRNCLLGFVSALSLNQARSMWRKIPNSKIYTHYDSNGYTVLEIGEVPNYLNHEFLKEAEKTYQWISAMHEDRINGADLMV